MHPLQRPGCSFGNGPAQTCSERNLREHHPGQRPAACRSVHHGNHNGREHISRRVVAAALHLQHRGRVVLQPQFLTPQDRKHGGGISGTDHRPQQKTLRPSPSQCKVTEQPRKPCRHHHAKRGQQHGFPHHRLHGFPTRAETAVEHNEKQRHAAHVLGKAVVVQIHRDGAHIAEHDTQHDEGQQSRHPDPRRNIVQPDAGKDYNYDEDEEKTCHFLSKANDSSRETCRSDTSRSG